MQTLTREQYNLLENEIFQSLIANPDFGMGEVNDCHEEAERIIREWTEKANIQIED